jgi:hypothetical protein
VDVGILPGYFEKLAFDFDDPAPVIFRTGVVPEQAGRRDKPACDQNT